MPHALAVDDDPNFLSALAELIEGQGFTTNIATTLRDARTQVSHKTPDVALVDLYLPDGSGIDLLKDLELGTSTEVVLMTGHADVESAVQALRLGASDYLTKPLDIGRLKNILANVASVQPGLALVVPAAEEKQEVGRLGLLLGASEPMHGLYEMLNRVAPTDATVFLIGESGTGKDLPAQGLLRARPRRHPVPGRDHRDAVRAPGQAPARAGDRHPGADRRRPPGRGRRARLRRHQPRPAQGGRRR